MRKASFACLAATLLVLVSLGVSGAKPKPGSAGPVTTDLVVQRFRAATGDTLRIDPRATIGVRYDALVLAPSRSKRARYGVFTLYVVTAADLETVVTELLADGRTGELGEPDRRGIRWEAGTTLTGERYWLAKKRYGANVVLWWFGTQERRVDAPFRRLDRALRRLIR